MRAVYIYIYTTIHYAYTFFELNKREKNMKETSTHFSID